MSGQTPLANQVKGQKYAQFIKCNKMDGHSKVKEHVKRLQQRQQVASFWSWEASSHHEDQGTYYDSAETDSLCEEDEVVAMNNPGNI
uniref:Uncharacterized protein n=1 Tax=Romanomermis culicivorax TaxID=13658 RepID=A0A915L9X4_ROMCU